jgi:hypothetical protein
MNIRKWDCFISNLVLSISGSFTVNKGFRVHQGKGHSSNHGMNR